MLKEVKNKVEKRLKYLKNIDDAPKISLSSLRDFKKFMSLHRHISKPAIGLLDGGNIQAEWHEELTIILEFEGRKKINFCIMFPDKRNVVKGVLPMNKLKKILDVLKVWECILV